MDVDYEIYSSDDRVNIRVLAFKDGVRSFANVLRPESFVDGTGVNVGDGVRANTNYRLSWRVSSDWDVDLSKVSVEFLVRRGDTLIPMDFVTIPAANGMRTIKISTNEPDSNWIFNALLWLYADNDPGLSLSNGRLINNGVILAEGTRIASSIAPTRYLFSKMGYGVLSGSLLDYARKALRVELRTTSHIQYAVTYPED
jgi:hypothetical protein